MIYYVYEVKPYMNDTPLLPEAVLSRLEIVDGEIVLTFQNGEFNVSIFLDKRGALSMASNLIDKATLL